jgi:N-acetylmuramoyl-L-alanine amidase
LRAPRLPALLLGVGIVLLTSLHSARVLAVEPGPSASTLKPASSPAPYVVAVDPGHGGSYTGDINVPWDPGVVVGSLMEKDLTLDLGLRLRRLLEKERVKVVMTRTSDRFLSIADRWAIVSASGARMFVSLHVNAFDGDPSINGLMVLYPRTESLNFARSIEGGLSQSLAPYQIADDGVTLKPELWVHSEIPTVTVEPAYLTNPREAALLQRPEFREAVAQGVMEGMLAADPGIEQARRAIERAQAQALAAQRTLVPGSRGSPLPGLEIWWLYAGAAIVFLILSRERPAIRMVAPRLRVRPSRRLMRRRRRLDRRPTLTRRI